jgi:predicted AAA+ superfamily ATPase
MSLLPRDALLSQVEGRLSQMPIVVVLGPRQCGKTTLARAVAKKAKQVHFFDLERPADQARLEQPMTGLEALSGLVVIDEAQLRPDLFPILRVLADREDLPARFLLSGSASPDLVRASSESLAGRAALIQMSGFTLDEVGVHRLRPLWLRGGFPKSFLAAGDRDSTTWREDFIQLFLERDLRNLGVQIPAPAMRRFWTMLAHYHGQVLNASEIGRSLGDSHTVIRRRLDVLTGAFMVRQLQPWFENAGKRVVKSPKVYIRDSGLLHTLLGITEFAALESHPKLGASWEGFVIEQLLSLLGDRNTYFWATHGGAELDLFFLKDGRRYGAEVKYADAPAMTRSMHVALEDLGLEHLWVVYPGKDAYELDQRVSVLPVAEISRIASA